MFVRRQMDALDILYSHAAFALIITNLQMAGMNRFRLIAALTTFVPLLVMSAYSEQPDGEAIQKRFASLPKRFSRRQLLNAMTQRIPL
jgi:CheY-like chemotaxis protein